MENLICFQAGPRQFAVAMEMVRNIHSAAALGLDRFQGSSQPMILIDDNRVPVIDLNPLLDDDALPSDWDDRKLILLNDRNNLLALAVDRILGTVTADGKDIHPLPPVFTGVSYECFPQVLHQGENLLPVINPNALTDHILPLVNSANQSADRQNGSGLTEKSWCCKEPDGQPESRPDPDRTAEDESDTAMADNSTVGSSRLNTGTDKEQTEPDCGYASVINSEPFETILNQAIQKMVAKKLQHMLARKFRSKSTGYRTASGCGGTGCNCHPD